MFSKSRTSSSGSSEQPMVTPNASLPRSCRLTIPPGYFSNRSERKDNRFQVSSTKQRRRAWYFPRAPVWRYGHCPHQSENNSSIGIEDEQTDTSLVGLSLIPLDLKKSFCFPVVCADTGCIQQTQDECEKCKLNLAEVVNPDFRWLSENIFHDGLRPSSFHQSKAQLCTRLQFCKDIRVGIDERWAMQEGSLVISIDPKFTNVDCETRAADEFELTYGDLYIVCRLYADFWALCAKISFSPMTGSCQESLAFLPICAVTLAANFSAFTNRCYSYASAPNSELNYPGNGLSVTPPERSHSLNASKQVFHGNSPGIELPAIAHEACKIFSLEGLAVDFVPLDSTLANLLSEIGGSRSQLRKQLSLKRIWNGWRNSDSESSERLHARHGKFFDHMHMHHDQDGRHNRRNRTSLSSASHGLRWLVGKSSQEETGRHRRNLRDIISNSTRSTSTGSESWRG